MQAGQIMVSYHDVKNNVLIDVSKDDEKNIYTFAINEGHDKMRFQSGQIYIPHITNLDSNGYLKYLATCEKLGTPSTLTLELGNEMRPSETHYLLTIPDPFMGNDVIVRLHHFIPLSDAECVRITMDRLNKKIDEKDVIIKEQSLQIENISTQLENVYRRLNQLEGRITITSSQSEVRAAAPSMKWVPFRDS